MAASRLTATAAMGKLQPVTCTKADTVLGYPGRKRPSPDHGHAESASPAWYHVYAERTGTADRPVAASQPRTSTRGLLRDAVSAKCSSVGASQTLAASPTGTRLAHEMLRIRQA